MRPAGCGSWITATLLLNVMGCRAGPPITALKLHGAAYDRNDARKLFSLLKAEQNRIKACEDVPLPAVYKNYLNTSFLGPEKTISVGAVNFAYFRFGPLSKTDNPGRTLVMIVGLGCTKSTWTPDLLTTLAASREVLIFDNRGSGHSSDKDGLDKLSVEGFAASTLGLWKSLSIEKPDILGWSMGGLISLQLATHFGDAVNKVVLVNSAIPPKPSKTDHRPSFNFPINLWEGETDPSLFFPDTAVGNAGLCRYVKLYRAMPKNKITEEVVKAQREALKAKLGKTDMYDKLKDVKNPTLALVGTKQGEGPSSYDLLSQIPTSMLVAFSDAAHGAVFQYALLAGTSIQNFLDSDIGISEAEFKPS